jgi:hypothetical protein
LPVTTTVRQPVNPPNLDDFYCDLRPYDFTIAYQMLGAVSETADVVQEASYG